MNTIARMQHERKYAYATWTHVRAQMLKIRTLKKTLDKENQRDQYLR